VALTHVSLPYNGVVGSYTPLIGEYGVVGVKSGFTDAAGGCDVMAVRVTVAGQTFNTYAVVLGQHSSDDLGLAGNAALALSRSLKASMRSVRTPSGLKIQWTGPAADVVGATGG
jgi:D-alanyl-D-alanine carboxypeptidase (penicillin-binding protein 5/6)